MRFLAPSAHRILDFATVVAFALAPTVLGLSGLPAALAWFLAAVHLLLTLVTDFRGAGAPPLPLHVHGAVELVVGPALLVLPWILGWVGTARVFYMAAGGVIVVVWGVSRYRTAGTGRPEA